MGKRDIRERAKRIRDAIPEKERQVCSEAIAGLLLRQPWYAAAEELLVYAAVQSEVSLSPFCAQAWRDGKRLYFPRVQGNDMEFYQVMDERGLVRGAFGVPEPWLSQGEAADRLLWRGTRAAVLAPGVAFSREGARLGYGKGYYDRFLSAHPMLFPVGICFEKQIFGYIPTEPIDRAMAQLVTERRVLSCETQGAD